MHGQSITPHHPISCLKAQQGCKLVIIIIIIMIIIMIITRMVVVIIVMLVIVRRVTLESAIQDFSEYFH